MGIIYYIVIAVVVIAGFFIIQKQFTFLVALVISLFTYVLLSIFPLVVLSLGIIETLILYGIIIVLASAGIVIMMPYLSKEERMATETGWEPLSCETCETIVDNDEIVGKTKEVEDGTLESKTKNIDCENIDCNDNTNIKIEISTEEKTIVKEVEEETLDEQIPVNSVYSDITRSITVSEDIPSNIEIKPIAIEESIFTEEQQAPGEQEDQPEVLEEEQEVLEEKQEVLLQPEVQDKPVELTAKEFVARGLTNSREGDYNEAIKLLLKALKLQPELKLKYLAVSEISTLYQHLGMYFMAANILAAYINQKDFKKHPGLKTWQKKLIFLNVITKLLKENKLPNLPYKQVPDFIKKRAFNQSKTY